VGEKNQIKKSKKLSPQSYFGVQDVWGEIRKFNRRAKSSFVRHRLNGKGGRGSKSLNHKFARQEKNGNMANILN